MWHQFSSALVVVSYYPWIVLGEELSSRTLLRSPQFKMDMNRLIRAWSLLLVGILVLERRSLNLITSLSAFMVSYHSWLMSWMALVASFLSSKAFLRSFHIIYEERSIYIPSIVFEEIHWVFQAVGRPGASRDSTRRMCWSFDWYTC